MASFRVRPENRGHSGPGTPLAQVLAEPRENLQGPWPTFWLSTVRPLSITLYFNPFFCSSASTFLSLSLDNRTPSFASFAPRPRRSLYCTPSFGPAQRSVLHSLERLIKHQQSDYYSPYTHSLQGILPTLELNSYTPYQNRTRSSKDLQQTQWPFSPS